MKVVWNILDMIDEFGEDKTNEFLSDYSCSIMKDGKDISLNPSVELFVKNNAVSFAKQKVSVSYIVCDDESNDILGFFTLTHRPIHISAESFSNTKKRKIKRFADYDKKSDSYIASGFLIAQLGKNFAVNNGNNITGKELISLVNRELSEMQHRMGGGIEYLDCEENDYLMQFYEGQGFNLLGKRISENDNKQYLQYVRFI